MKFILLLLMFSLMNCSGIQRQESAIFNKDINAVSDLHSATLEKMYGLIKIEDNGDHLKLDVEVSGLKPNSKLFLNIHEIGICEGPYYTSSGKSYLGNIGNIITDEKGAGKEIILLPKRKSNDLSLITGKSLLIDRIACGLIKPVN